VNKYSETNFLLNYDIAHRKQNIPRRNFAA
jgi:hypothetical protein